MDKLDRKNRLIIIILSFVLGLAGGIGGAIFTRIYILERFYNIPLSGEFDYSGGNLGGSNIIIKDAKKIVVEQNDKITETINSARGSLVGIFKVNPAAKAEKENVAGQKFNLSDFYKLGEEVGQGFIITSDGWIITAFKPANLDYAIITQDKKIYNIDKIIGDSLTPFYFVHINAMELPVRGMAEKSEIKNGQLVLALNWKGEAEQNSIISSADRGNNFLFFSDLLADKIVLSDALDKKFFGSFLFNLNGDIIGLINENGEAESISHITPAIRGLLKNKEIKRPALGVNYLDLSLLVNYSSAQSATNQYQKGALIYKNLDGASIIKGSAAEKAGLKEGDIIVSVDDLELDGENNLTDIIQNYIAGDIVNIAYLRNGESGEVEVQLGEIGK